MRLNIEENTARFWRSSFVRSVVVLASGTAVSQIITAAASPILSRLYTPEQFGVLSVFLAFATPIAVIASLRYDVAIMLPPKDSEDARVLLNLAVIFTTMISVLSLIVLLLFHNEIADTIGFTRSSSWLTLAALFIFAFSLGEILRMWALRNRRFRLVTTVSIIETGSRSVIQIGTRLLAACEAFGLILGQILGVAISTLLLFLHTVRKDRLWLAAVPNLGAHEKENSGSDKTQEEVQTTASLPPRIHASRGYLRSLVRVSHRYRDFPIYQGGGKFFFTISREWVILLIGYFFGGRVVGLYAFGFRILNMPLYLFGKSIGDVFFERGARDRITGELGKTEVKMVRALMVIAIPTATMFFVVAPTIFSFVFGPEWREAGVYLRYLIPLFVVRFGIGPINAVFSICEKQRTDLLWQIVYLVMSLVSVVIGGLAGSIKTTLILYSFSGVLMYLVMLRLGLGYGGAKILDLFRSNPSK